MILPTVQQLMSYIHLLPASEYHHHARTGGLFCHALQCASLAVAYSKTNYMDTEESHSRRYDNKPKWILIGALTGLLHDVGKVFDMDVFDARDNHWNPNLEPLVDWFRKLQLDEYFIEWKPSRPARNHELRAIELIHRHLIGEDLVEYLGDASNLFFDAMNNSIAFHTGPLDKVLRAAEAQSIESDFGIRRRIGSDLQQLSGLTLPFVEAIKANIKNRVYGCNVPGAPLHHTTAGLYLSISVLEPLTNIPGNVLNVKDICLALLKDQVIELNESGDYIWKISNPGSDKLDECVKFKRPEEFLGDSTQFDVNTKTCREEKERHLTLMAPQNDFLDTVKHKLDTMLSELDLCETTECLTAHQAEQFVAKLTRTLANNLDNGQGDLVHSIMVRNGRVCCDATKALDVLERHGIDQASFKMLLRSQNESLVDFDANENLIYRV